MGELKPCAHCGGRAELRDAASGRQNWVECMTTDCHAMGPNRGTPRDATSGWNRRTPPRGVYEAAIEDFLGIDENDQPRRAPSAVLPSEPTGALAPCGHVVYRNGVNCIQGGCDNAAYQKVDRNE